MNTEYLAIRNEYESKRAELRKQYKDKSLDGNEYRAERLRLLEEMFNKLIIHMAAFG